MPNSVPATRADPGEVACEGTCDKRLDRKDHPARYIHHHARLRPTNCTVSNEVDADENGTHDNPRADGFRTFRSCTNQSDGEDGTEGRRSAAARIGNLGPENSHTQVDGSKRH